MRRRSRQWGERPAASQRDDAQDFPPSSKRDRSAHENTLRGLSVADVPRDEAIQNGRRLAILGPLPGSSSSGRRESNSRSQLGNLNDPNCVTSTDSPIPLLSWAFAAPSRSTSNRKRPVFRARSRTIAHASRQCEVMITSSERFANHVDEPLVPDAPSNAARALEDPRLRFDILEDEVEAPLRRLFRSHTHSAAL